MAEIAIKKALANTRQVKDYRWATFLNGDDDEPVRTKERVSARKER
jgi:hypothetical protein